MTKTAALLALVALLCTLLPPAFAQNKVVVKRPANPLFRTLLSLDSGAYKDIMASQLLKRLERIIGQYFVDHPEFLPPNSLRVSSVDDLEVHLADFFDCIAGVAAGSWIGLYYASKGGNGATDALFSRPDIIEKYGTIYPGSAMGLDVFFEEYGPNFYPAPPTPDLSSIDLEANDSAPVRGVNAPTYPIDGLVDGLTAIYGNTRLSDLSTSVIINAYDINHRNPVLFTFDNAAEEPYTSATVVRSRSAPRVELSDEEDAILRVEYAEYERPYESDLEIRKGEDFFLKDVALASSSFPGQLEAKEMQPIDNGTSTYLCIDGSVVAPNPIMHALNNMLSIYPTNYIFEIATLSIGSGVVVGEWSQHADGGAIEWLGGGALLSILSDGCSEQIQSNVDFLLYEELNILPGQYLRIQFFAEEDSSEGRALMALMDPEYMPTFKELGQKAADEYETALELFVEHFIFPARIVAQ